MRNKLWSVILLTSILLVLFSSCENTKGLEMGVYSVTVDSCEYVIARSSNGIGVVHKQNCKFCGVRNNPNKIATLPIE